MSGVLEPIPAAVLRVFDVDVTARKKVAAACERRVRWGRVL